MAEKRRVVVTGLGFITCLGNDQSSVLDSLKRQKSGITGEGFPAFPKSLVKAMGKPPGFEVDSPNWRKWKLPSGFSIDPTLKRTLAPQGVFAVCAVEQVMRESGLTRDMLQDGRTGLYCASVGSPLMLTEHVNAMRKVQGARGNPSGILSSIAGTLNFNLAGWLGIRGSNCGFVSACTSGSHALGFAWDDIFLGRQERILVVGAEETSGETLLPFSAMRALSVNPDATRASRPFDRDRDGFVGAGGAVAILLEEETAARKREAPIYAEMAGWAQASDGFHSTAPEPEGKGLAIAMQKTIDSSGVHPEEVDYICAHATSTSIGDIAEAKAIRRVFPDRLEDLLVSSAKGLTGHSLSMSGALEFAICCLMLKNGFILGNCNLDNIDPNCDFLNLPKANRLCEVNTILNNSSGFGGSNTCNLLKRF